MTGHGFRPGGGEAPGARGVGVGALAAAPVVVAPVVVPVVVVLVVVALGALVAPAQAATTRGDGVHAGRVRTAAAPPWHVVLGDVARTGRRTAYRAELHVVAHRPDGDALSRVYDVRNDGSGTVTLRAGDELTLRLGDGGGSVAHHADGWFAPLPASALASPERDLAALAEKYDVEATGGDRVLDRPATVLEIRRRADGRLRERLWVDVETCVVVRRESYDGEGRLLGEARYVSLEVGAVTDVDAARRATATGPQVSRARLDAREHGVEPVSRLRLDALAEAGWTVPEELPHGYRVTGSYAVEAAGSQPLQLVYGDGLYSVSLFEQRGHPDWRSLPPGAVPSDLVEGTAYEWPGAVPRRLVWEADGTTYTLVGDAPPDEFAAIARALPQPSEPHLGRRLGQGLRTLLSWVSPWGR